MALVATYTAKLVAALTVPDVNPGVNNIQELADNNAYKIIVPKGGNTEAIFKVREASLLHLKKENTFLRRPQ